MRNNKKYQVINNKNIIEGLHEEPNMFHNYETEKISRKASDVAENL